MFSSPFAALDSTRKRIALLQAKPNVSGDEQTEISALQRFEETLLPINALNFSKFVTGHFKTSHERTVQNQPV